MNFDTVALLNANKLTQIAKDSLWKHENIKNNDMTSSNRPFSEVLILSFHCGFSTQLCTQQKTIILAYSFV